jgi:glycosyltransferase involved in cell wall biosynthesis
MRISVIHGNDGSDVRVGKTCRSLMRLGHDTYFIGWDRRPSAKKEIDLGGAVPHIMRHETPHGRGDLAGQARFFAHIARVLIQTRPQVVCAVNEELACVVLPLKRVFYDRLVCDVFDSLRARASTRRPLEQMALRLISDIGSLGSDRLIATDGNRREMLGRFAHKAIVIENVPEDPGEVLALALPEGPVRIWAAGSLEVEKGFGQLLAAIEGLPDAKIISAGWPYDRFASEVFVKHPRVEFHGIVTAQKALELAASCDAVFSYYAPIHAYRINASPNKVYDAMAVGRPVLINREVRLAEWVERERIGYLCGYEDVDCLHRIIAGLAVRRNALPGFAARTRELFRRRYNWGLMESRLADMYAGLERELKP